MRLAFSAGTPGSANRFCFCVGTPLDGWQSVPGRHGYWCDNSTAACSAAQGWGIGTPPGQMLCQRKRPRSERLGWILKPRAVVHMNVHNKISPSHQGCADRSCKKLGFEPISEPDPPDCPGPSGATSTVRIHTQLYVCTSHPDCWNLRQDRLVPAEQLHDVVTPSPGLVNT